MLSTRWSGRFGLLILVGGAVSACRHSIPVTVTPDGAQPPATESIVLLMPLGETDALRVLRRTILETGLLTSVKHPTERWVRVDLGGESDSEEVDRQWHLFVRYDAMPWGSTMIQMSAVEHQITYLSNERSRDRARGFSKVRSVSNRSRGLSRQAWQRVEQIAEALVEKGGEPISELGVRTAVRR